MLFFEVGISRSKSQLKFVVTHCLVDKFVRWESDKLILIKLPSGVHSKANPCTPNCVSNLKDDTKKNLAHFSRTDQNNRTDYVLYWIPTKDIPFRYLSLFVSVSSLVVMNHYFCFSTETLLSPPAPRRWENLILIFFFFVLRVLTCMFVFSEEYLGRVTTLWVTLILFLVPGVFQAVV